ncbi:MAG: twin-arginine translocation pathway signal protein [Pseudomonadales bacterium RIFCSPLOWO2_12_59_9]|nr:MAG: twin-arginine translocation pathway signal protein [Pseudomonadales bacterium RIFCSPLOWO2_12_59_9]
MSTDTFDAPGLSRRGLLKVGLLGTAFLATAGVTATLSGCSASMPASGLSTLRASDLPFLRALIPVIIDGAVSAEKMSAAVEQSIRGIDYSLTRFSPEMQKLTVQLFDVLALGLTRGPLTGVWGSWENASAAQVSAFLSRWQNSSISLLKLGHASLLQLVMLAWYGQPESWAHCGYPGPPKV